MELRSRRKLSTETICWFLVDVDFEMFGITFIEFVLLYITVSENKGDISTDDEKNGSLSNSEDWLISDGDFESDENSDVDVSSGKRTVVQNVDQADTCTTDDKNRMRVGSKMKAKGSGSTSEVIENDDAMGNLGDEEGPHGLPLVDSNNLDSSVEVLIEEIQNVPLADVVLPVKKRKRNDKPLLKWQIWEKENKEWVSENKGEVIDLENHSERVDETAEPSSDLTMPLLRYQKEWLAWALKQEASETRGGILADEMGMGKTIQAIALVLAKRERSLDTSQFTEPSLSGQSSTGLLEVKGTLVICPVVAVTQWESEINRFTAKGSTKVLIYHGPLRGKNLGQLSEYDFVLTTYALVESEYRRNVMPAKKPCIYCGKLFYQSKMSVHHKYFCGPGALRTANQSKQQRKNGKGKKHEEELSFSPKDIKRNLKASKIDLNPQHTSDMENGASSQQSETKGKSILHSLKWERIILDEAHSIKDRKCNTAKAVFALESSFKWALSGTPLQNRVGELYSLIRFLHINPYSYYFCKDCDCKTLDYSSSADCKSCPHKSVRHFCWWNKNVATPIQNSGYLDDGKKAMILLKDKILKGIVLRRTKKGRAADLALPPRIVSLRRDNMDIKEEDYYTSLYNESQAEFNTYIQQGTLMNNYAHIFDLLTRLRQAVNHPYLVVYSKSAALRNETVIDPYHVERPCGICCELAEEAVVTSCEHVFCKACLIDYTTSAGAAVCPKCPKLLTVDLSSPNSNQIVKTTVRGYKAASILNRIQIEDFQTSTKIDALREEIRFMIERDGSAKGLVFSQFTSFLDLISYSLQESGITFVQLVGSMSMSARDAAITKFKEDPDCRIFLMSLKAGGVALNLTVASHVFLMDPWWNPAVERQAQDRIHRIGQYKPIRIVRFVIENSIEERILKLQEKKELVFEGTVGGSSEALGKLTEADLKFLFT
ncbi:unnamed protein product [Rhodiola kirilowii]